MRTSIRVFSIVGALAMVLPLLLLSGQPARGMQDANATPTAVGIPGIDASATAHLGGTIPGDPQIQLVKVAEGFNTPTNIAFPPDDSGRIFVVELNGLVHIINPDGSVAPEPFLDLTQTVATRPGQQGLLGLAFHPGFAENGKFYVDYNDLYDNGAVTISEFTVDPENPNRADTKTERPLLVIQKRSPLHNGGTLRFGKDGYLYISVGDGGWQGDVWDNAQNRFSLLGKILRIDVDRVGPGQPYGIPADNPFAGMWRSDNPYPGQPPAAEAGDKKGKNKRDRTWPGYVAPEYRNSLPPVRAEIWALGFRNPWQYAFDPANGDLYIGDVGQGAWEEIDVEPRGAAAVEDAHQVERLDQLERRHRPREPGTGRGALDRGTDDHRGGNGQHEALCERRARQADKIARLALARPSDHVFESDLDASTWFGLVLAAIGAWHLFDAVLLGFRLWVQFKVGTEMYDSPAAMNDSLKWQAVGCLLEAGISVFLILGGRGLAAALHRLRYAGTPGSH